MTPNLYTITLNLKYAFCSLLFGLGVLYIPKMSPRDLAALVQAKRYRDAGKVITADLVRSWHKDHNNAPDAVNTHRYRPSPRAVGKTHVCTIAYLTLVAELARNDTSHIDAILDNVVEHTN